MYAPLPGAAWLGPDAPDLTAPDASEAARCLRARSDALDAEREALKRKRRYTPRHITVIELDRHQALVALPERKRLILDVIRMIAYRTETRMMPVVAQAPARPLPIRRRRHPGTRRRHPRQRQ